MSIKVSKNDKVEIFPCQKFLLFSSAQENDKLKFGFGVIAISGKSICQERDSDAVTGASN